MVNRGNSIQSVTLLRGLAALGVCIVHFYVANGVVYSQPYDRLFFAGQLGVTVFFVISGFILPYSLYRKNYTLSAFPKFLLKRSIRIDPPYWATIILLFIVDYVPLQRLNFEAVTLHVFYVVPFFKGQEWYNSVFWTLAVEFQYYILLGLLFPLLMRVKPLLSVTLVLAGSIICILLNFSMRELIFTSLHNFAVGYIVFLYFIEKISLRNAIVILLGFCAFLVFKVSIVTGLVPAITALFIMLFNSKSPKALLFLGNISYSLYLIHEIVFILYLKFIKAYITNAFMLGITSIGLAILVAYIFYLVFEKPALSFSKKIKLKGGE